MSDEVSIKEFITEKFIALEKATELSRCSMERRLEAMNEFRAQLKDQASTFLTKENYGARHDLIQKQVDDLRLGAAELSGKASQSSVNVTLFIAIVSLVITAIGFIHSLWR